MIVEGERIRELVKRAEQEVILCAPFIKAEVLRIILEAVPQVVPVRIVTRWRAAEVAVGVSDLEVYDIVTERRLTELRLLNSLHAKLYVADENCLVGSANLTAAALGWRKNANLEILLPTTRSNRDVQYLVESLAMAVPATYQIREEIEKQAAALGATLLDEGGDIGVDDVQRLLVPWLPRCAAPDKLFTVYKDPNTTDVVAGTLWEAAADLNDLAPPPGMNQDAFNACIGETLLRLPSFCQIFDKIAGRLTDADGAALIADLRPDLFQSDLQKQWQIVRDWIGIFCKDRFEVAPDSYVVRLKSQ